MKKVNEDAIRARLTKELYNLYAANGEDCGMITSNCFNFPVVTEDGEEGWVEITVKVTKEAGDEGYDKRTEYEIRQANAAARKAKAEATKAANIKKQQERAAQRAAKSAKLQAQANELK